MLVKRLRAHRFSFGRRATRYWARPAWVALAFLLAAAALQGCRRDAQDALAQQSPIDIAGEFGGDAPSVEFAYGGGADRIVNSGMFIRAEYSDGGVIRIDGREYGLAEAHVHNPSEHTIEGESFALEMHLVHRNAAGDIAVAAVLYKAGEHNPNIQGLIDGAPEGANEYAEPPSRMDARDWLPPGGGYYAYAGSLTTPPHTEGVQWIVMADALEISEAQVGALAALTGVRTNNREVQPINRRRINYGTGAPIVREKGGCGCCACSGFAAGQTHISHSRQSG